MDEEAYDLGGRSDMSKRFKLRLAKFIAAKTTSYFDPTAPSKNVAIQTSGDKSNGLHDAFVWESCFVG